MMRKIIEKSCTADLFSDLLEYLGGRLAIGRPGSEQLDQHVLAFVQDQFFEGRANGSLHRRSKDVIIKFA